MPDHFKLTFQALFVLFEYFNVIIQEADNAEPYRTDQHHDDIYIANTCKQQRWYEYTGNNDQATHCRRTFFGGLPIQSQLTDGFSDLLLLQKLDHLLPVDHRNDQ
ncbi:hypothetical protein FQZ97_797980 [compost metagenome]